MKKPFHYSNFIEHSGKLGTFTKEELDHVILMMKTIEMHMLYGYPAGSFCSAIADDDYISAVQHADYINRKYIFFYKDFREYLKQFQQ